MTGVEALNAGMASFYEYCVQLGDVIAERMGTTNPLDIARIVRPIQDENQQLKERIQELEQRRDHTTAQQQLQIQELNTKYKSAQNEYENAAVPIIEELDYLGIAKVLYTDKIKKTLNRHALHCEHFLLEEPQTYGYLAKGLIYFTNDMRNCFVRMHAGKPFGAELNSLKEHELDEIPDLLDELAEAAAVGLPSDDDTQRAGLNLVVSASNAALSHSQSHILHAPSFIESLHLAKTTATSNLPTATGDSRSSAVGQKSSSHMNTNNTNPSSLTAAAERASQAIASADYVTAAHALADVSKIADGLGMLHTMGDDHGHHGAQLEEALSECHRAVAMKQAASVTERYAHAITLVKSYSFVEGMFGEQPIAA